MSKILSIDIRDETVSGLLFSSSLKGNQVDSFCHIRLAEAPSDTENLLFWAISRMAGEMDITGSTCILSVSPADVIYRNVTVPFKERRKIMQLLPFELESSLPSAVEELTIDFNIVRKSDYTDIIAAAVKTETVNDIVDVLKSVDINPRYISVSPVAEAICLAKAGTPRAEDFIYASIDDNSATACIVCSGKLHLARTFKLPGTPSEHRAARLKKELSRITSAFETIYDFDFHPEQIMISFAGAHITDADMAGIVSALKNAFEVNIRAIDMFTDANLKMIPGPMDDAFEHRLYNGALGLAGIEIARFEVFNFGQGHFLFQKYWLENKTELITAGVFFALIFILIMANAIVQVRSLEARVQKLDAEIAGIFRTTLPGETRIIDPLHQMRVEIEEIKQKNAISANAGINVANIEILNEISRRIPGEIDLLITNLVRSDDNVTISGTISTFQAVDEVKGQLENSALFERITISSANMDNTINRVRFRIRADLADI